MSKTTQLNIRTDLDLKRDVERIFKKLGLSHSEAVKLFYSQVVINEGLPFDVKIPRQKEFNDETIKAIQDTNKGIGTKRHKNSKALFEHLGI